MRVAISSRTVVYSLILVAVCVGLLLLPIDLPYSVDVPGKVIASREWVVSKGTDGRLIAVLVDHKRGVRQAYSVTQFERGDAVAFNLRPHIVAGAAIAAMDTIGAIHSNETERRIAELRGDLATAEASLQLYLTGEKASVVREAQQQLASSKKQVEERQRILARLRSLYDRGLISEEQYEIELGKSVLDDIDVTIAEARLQSVESGAKKEQIEFIRSRIRATRDEIEVLERRLADFTLISPISGTAYHVFSGDTLLVVGDMTEYVIVMPVKWRQRRYVLPKQTVEVKASDIASVPDATLLRLENRARPLNGEQVLMATAVTNGETSELVPGLMIRCSIQCGYVRPGEYVLRFLRSLFA